MEGLCDSSLDSRAQNVVNLRYTGSCAGNEGGLPIQIVNKSFEREGEAFENEGMFPFLIPCNPFCCADTADAVTKGFGESWAFEEGVEAEFLSAKEMRLTQGTIFPSEL